MLTETSSQRAESITETGMEFGGRETLEFFLQLTLSDRELWLARRLEAYREACVQFAAVLLREHVGKTTVAEAEAQAVIETDGLTKVVPYEAALYALLLSHAPTT